eukprot:scaffold71720_cov75-Phaeocystis_antarctica.AAC.2
MSWPDLSVWSSSSERPVLFARDVWRMPRDEWPAAGAARRADATFPSCATALAKDPMLGCRAAH